MFYKAPWPRGPVEKIGPTDKCIYCGLAPPHVELTDEHIIPDGLGGDLLYLRASCLRCAKHTNSFETPVINGAFQYARGVAGVRARKRKFKALTARVNFKDGRPEAELELPDAAPFFLTLPISDGLPGILAGARAEDAQKLFRAAVFGEQDWVAKARKWAGNDSQVRFGYRGHMGQLGQLVAKAAHAYACAKLGSDGFAPFLLNYIRADKPAFDAHLMGIHSGHGTTDHLHELTLNVATIFRPTAIGISRESFYVVGMRLFSNHPSPSFLAVIGRPIGIPPPEIPGFGGLRPI
ncbi:MAG TPA: HNH endonuclease [Caulobacteraceae bacterium]